MLSFAPATDLNHQRKSFLYFYVIHIFNNAKMVYRYYFLENYIILHVLYFSWAGVLERIMLSWKRVMEQKAPLDSIPTKVLQL
jgi:hypothetical protein